MKRVQLLRNRCVILRNSSSRRLVQTCLGTVIRGFRKISLNAPVRFAVAIPLLLLLVSATFASATFASANAQSEDSGAQLYFFTSEGCAPCRQVEPEIESLKQAGYDVTTVNLAQSPDWGATFSVDRTPTVIMVANQRIVGRHAGLIDAGTLKQWFKSVGVEPGQKSQAVETRVAPNTEPSSVSNGADRSDGVMFATYAALPDSTSKNSSFARLGGNFRSRGTLHAGTTQPADAAEATAMNATVRLRVRDAEGISYATGTVIHSHAGEWLVMTCGHTFREAGFNGKITAEFNFLEGPIQSAEGELISYDSESKDVALVAVHAGRDIEPVKLANPNFPVDRGLDVFSIGCDGGAEPTIRHSAIKNKAVYAPGDGSVKSSQRSVQGAVKYDIHGRPAIGRSGGGLFNDKGELIGVCNAAAVESDEGIYSALDSLHSQIEASQLGHLFDGSSRTETASEFVDEARENRFSSLASSSSQFTKSRMQPIAKPSAAGNESEDIGGRSSKSRNLVSRPHATGTDTGSDAEVIIIVRSKTAPQLGESITIENPTSELIQYLAEMKREAEHR